MTAQGYTVTVTRPGFEGAAPVLVSSEEVDTLDDAQARVDELIEEHGGSVDEYPDVPASGHFSLDVNGSSISVEPR